MKMKPNIPPEKRHIYGLIGVGLLVLAVLIFVGIQTTGDPENFELNKDGIIEFFAQNIDQVVPGEGWRVTEVRFAEDDRAYDGVYVRYGNDDRAEAFLMLVNPSDGSIDYEIVGVFDVEEDESLELVSGVDSFAGENQEIWRVISETEWERVN